MSKLKKGESISSKEFIKINIMPYEKLNIVNVYGAFAEVEHRFLIHKDCVKPFKENKMTYQNSKRYKLHQAIKNTGHTATDLSIASGHGKFYFGSEAKESRFNSRGDLSDKQYNNLIKILELAERKLNEVPAVTVEDEKPKVLTLDDNTHQQDYQRQVIGQLTKQQIRKRITKSKTEVNKKTAYFVLFLIAVVFLFVVTGVIKGVLP